MSQKKIFFESSTIPSHFKSFLFLSKVLCSSRRNSPKLAETLANLARLSKVDKKRNEWKRWGISSFILNNPFVIASAVSIRHRLTEINRGCRVTREIRTALLHGTALRIDPVFQQIVLQLPASVVKKRRDFLERFLRWLKNKRD